jgi:rRNA-processing protein FCF1
MGKKKYVFDSNVFINLQRNQPMDVYVSLWEKIDTMFDEGIIFSSYEVYEEISIGDDALVEWAKSKKDLFVLSSNELQQGVRDILKAYPQLILSGKRMNSADPFLIALAKKESCIVVTEERLSNNMIAPKIPDVCAKYSIESMNFINFLRNESITI